MKQAAIALTLAAALSAPTARAAADAPWLHFAQLDASASSSTLVLVRALHAGSADAPAPLLTATATRWADGQAAALGLVQRWALAGGAGHAARLGLGAGIDHFRSRAEGDARDRTGASLRAQAEADGPLGGARYYLLAQASSFRGGWFATAQLSGLGPGAALELSRYGDDDYHATSAALRLPLGAPGWALRVGAVRDADGRRPFIGLGWNGF